MSVYRGSCDWAARREGREGREARPGAWRPLEVAAVVAGFAIYWPVGLAVLFAKMWQRREGFSGDLFEFARAKATAGMPADWQARREEFSSKWNATRWGFRGTGNAAFDEWRSGEIERLEAERRKLVDAEREFGAYLDRLRKARDREEFDRFMAERNTRQDGTTV